MRIRKEIGHLISFVGKWTEMDVRYYVREGTWLFSGHFLFTLTTFLLSIGFARLATKDTFGQFQFFFAVLGILGALVVPGVNNAVLLGVSQGKDGSLLKGINLKLKWSVIAVLGLLGTAAYFYFYQKPHYELVWLAFLLIAPLAPVLYSLDLTSAFFAGKRQFFWSSVHQQVCYGLSNVAVLVALFFTQNIVFLVVLFFVVQTVGFLVAFLFAKSKINNKRIDPDFTSYSMHLSVLNFIPQVKSFVDKVVVTYFLGFAATAVYSVGNAVAEQLNAVSKSINIVVFPKLAQIKPSKLNSEVKKRTLYLFLFLMALVVPLILVLPFVIPFFFSNEYVGSVKIAQLLLLIALPRAIGFILTRVHEVHKDKKKLYFISITSSTVEIVSMVSLTPFFGINGLIGAKAISNVFYVILAWAML